MLGVTQTGRVNNVGSTSMIYLMAIATVIRTAAAPGIEVLSICCQFHSDSSASPFTSRSKWFPSISTFLQLLRMLSRTGNLQPTWTEFFLQQKLSANFSQNLALESAEGECYNKVCLTPEICSCVSLRAFDKMGAAASAMKDCFNFKGRSDPCSCVLLQPLQSSNGQPMSCASLSLKRCLP